MLSSDVGCKTVANMIKGKTPEEIRKLFNIVNDFTPEEEVRVYLGCGCSSFLTRMHHFQAQIKKENVSVFHSFPCINVDIPTLQEWAEDR